MSHPRILLLDEPSLGLAPLLVKAIFATLEEINRAGVTILLVEQNARAALAICDRAYVLQNGRILFSGVPDALRSSERVCRAYLGESP